MTRGRRPKPTRVKELNGNPGRRPLNAKEPVPAGELATAPAYLTPAQLALWHAALADAPPGLLTQFDATALEAYVVWRDTFSRAAEELMLRGAVSVDIKGERRVAPEVAVMGKATLLMLKACVEMGMTPSSRSRLQYEAPAAAGNDFEDV